MQRPLVISTIIDPKIAATFSSQEWNLLLQQARSSRLQLRLLALLKAHDLIQHVPVKILKAFENEKYRVNYLTTQTHKEVELLNEVLREKNIVPIYLKGAAYVLSNLPVSAQRLYSDIDVLLDKQDIEDAEFLLKCEGFVSEKTNDYDQKYYRLYMHEIPALRHLDRGTVLDLHHNILPVCGEHPVNIDLIKQYTTSFTDARNNEYKVLQPHAMFLHASVHLFNESEFDKGLRDLHDLASMYSDFTSQDNEFVEKVIDLAVQTELTKALYYSFQSIQHLLNISLSDSASQFVLNVRGQIRFPALYDYIFERVLIPYHKSCDSPSVTLAKFLAYCRGHLLRMPLRLLIPHLTRKSWLRCRDMFKKDKESPKTLPKL